MTPEQAIEQLKELAGNKDYEVAHLDADRILCDLLTALGHQNVVDAWEEVGRWYA